MLAVKTSDQEVTNQRVSFGLENSVYIMHVLHSIARGGGGIFGDIELTALVLNGTVISSLFSARQVKQCWSRF